MATARLRSCPCCGTPIDKAANIGLRDAAWVNSKLPGKVGGTDIDWMLERHGKVLIMEFKPAGVRPGKGQRMTFDTLRVMGCEVWVVQGDGPVVDVDFGDGLVSHLPLTELADEAVRWFEEA